MLVSAVLVGMSAVGFGLFCGFILAMASVVQAVLDDLPAPEYTRVMQGIIAHGRRSWVVKVLLLVPLFAAFVVLPLLWQARTVFVLLLVSTLVFLAGALVTSRRLAEPLYDVIMQWDAQAPPDDWTAQRRRWFQINLIRASSAFVACALATIAVTILVS